MNKLRNIIKSNSLVLKNFSFLAILQIFNLALPLVTIPYVISIVGAENYGLLAFSLATIMYFNIIVDYGFNLTATREVAVHREDLNKLKEIFGSVITIKTILMLLCFIVLLMLVFFVDVFSLHSKLYLFTFGIVVGQAFFPIWFFQGMEDMKYITYLNVISKSFFTAAIFIFIKEENDVFLVPLFNSLGGCFSGIVSLFILKKQFNVVFEFQKIEIIKKYLKDSWDVFVIDFLPNMYNNFSTFLLGFFAPLEFVGFYALASKLIGVLNSFLYVIRNATFPYLNKDSSKMQMITKITVGVGLLFSVCVFAFSGFLVPLVFGTTGENSLLYLYILALSPLFLAIAISYGSNRLLILKKDKVMRNITIVYSVIGFIIALILIPLYGALGAAITIVLTRFIMAILTYKKSMKYD
ncbi:flippase [Tenacibaculum soleae]|uniref:flippase n=1 Tax=Tenacibaculum soleae TaxID=447689 RepID=UPI002301D7CD|nr:flippase [Tenacibaculum soleae]